jgi:hypothetical protein
MRLTAETFSELVRSLRSNPRGAAEKRTKPRVGLRGRAAILVRDPRTGFGEEVPVGVRDVSATGLGLTCARGLREGDTFVLLLDGDKARNAQDVRCTVAYCRRVSEELYRIGARLDDDRPPGAASSNAAFTPASRPSQRSDGPALDDRDIDRLLDGLG